MTSSRPSADVLAPADSEEERQEKLAAWDPVELLVPEWRYLQKPSLFPQQQNSSGLMVTEMQRGPDLHPAHQPSRRGQPDEEGQRGARVHPARRDGPRQRPGQPPGQAHPQRQADLGARHRGPRRGDLPPARPSTRSALGSRTSSQSPLWACPPTRRTGATSQRRFSETAKLVDPDTRLPAPRYWLLHTLSHALIREMAMSCGYGAASLTERIYGWTSTAAARSRSRAADLHHRVRQRRHPRRAGRACRSPPGCKGSCSRRSVARRGARRTQSVRCAPRATRRTSSTAPPAIAARSPPRPRARRPTASSTAASC